MSIVRSDRVLDVVDDEGVIPGAAGDGAATDHRSSIADGDSAYVFASCVLPTRRAQNEI